MGYDAYQCHATLLTCLGTDGGQRVMSNEQAIGRTENLVG